MACQADHNWQVPGSSGLGLLPMCAHYEAKARKAGLRCLDFGQVRNTDARFLRQQPLISMTSQGLAAGTPCALAAVGIRGDVC